MQLSITFFGLCAFVVKGNRTCALLPNCDSSGNEAALRSAHSAHEHRARMAVAVDDVDAEGSVDPDLLTFFRNPIANWNIESLDLEVLPPAATNTARAKWASDVLMFADLDPQAEAYDFFGTESPITRCARVHLVGGSFKVVERGSPLKIQGAFAGRKLKVQAYATAVVWTSDDYPSGVAKVVMRRPQEPCQDERILLGLPSKDDPIPVGISNTAVSRNGLQHFGLYYRLFAKYQRPQPWPQGTGLGRPGAMHPPIWECVPVTVIEE